MGMRHFMWADRPEGQCWGDWKVPGAPGKTGCNMNVCLEMSVSSCISTAQTTT